MSDQLTFDWGYDCGGDRVLDMPLAKFYAVAWPEGSYSASVIIGDETVAELKGYGARGSQAAGMATAEAWVQERHARAVAAVRAAMAAP